jgi:hypothetical protein
MALMGQLLNKANNAKIRKLVLKIKTHGWLRATHHDFFEWPMLDAANKPFGTDLIY